MHARSFGVFAIIGLFSMACGGAGSAVSSDEPTPAHSADDEHTASPGAQLVQPVMSTPTEAPLPAETSATSETTEPTSETPSETPSASTPECPPTESVQPTVEPTPIPPAKPPVTALTLDACDEADFMNVTWTQADRDNLVIKFAPGTVVERDLEEIASVRNTLYKSISDTLGVQNVGKISITMSPNRVAATKHGYAKGVAWHWLNKIEVVYLGTAGSYEVRSPGHELAHVISGKIDGATYHAPFLDEGLAEYLDGSKRDLHEVYVASLRAGTESMSVTRFTSRDVWGDNYERAGSFVKFLIERYGMAKFQELWKGSAITYSGYGYTMKNGAYVSTAMELEKAIDSLATTVYGAGFDTLRLEWEAALKPHFATPPTGLSAADYAEIENVVANMDEAQTHGNAAQLRSTWEGFYCDYETENDRAYRATAAVEARGTMTTTVLSAWPTGTRNYPSALVHALRREVHDGTTTDTTSIFWLEHFPVGWRMTWVERW
jgi:hypothetical protein